jgi:hypothetical protein
MIKLELGKSYRNRKGEIVAITGIDRECRAFPFEGSDMGLYAEDGSYDENGESCPDDLIEEVVDNHVTLSFSREELECMFNIVNHVIAWEAPLALQSPDLEDPVYCLARDNYLEAKMALNALRRAC